MFLYLAKRDYNLFYTVREHIEALHLGRRQLLAQTLSAEGTVALRGECVGCLVSGNIVQGLDVIVRHPTWGGLVTVDVEGEVDPRSWVSTVRMYAMQVALAYMDVRVPAMVAAAEYTAFPTAPMASASSSSPSDINCLRGYSRALGSLAPPHRAKPESVKFYHVFLDVRALVASICSPGETTELYFSLYNKNDMRFVTEDFWAVLNHNGVFAREPSAKIHTLFTDLVQADIQEPIYLVCKIVRNGALKITNTFNSAIPVENPCRGSESSVRENGASGCWDTPPGAKQCAPRNESGTVWYDLGEYHGPV